MLRLSDFFDKNIPKMVKFYLDLLARAPRSADHAFETPAINPPKVVADNGLATIWNQMHLNKGKVEQYIAANPQQVCWCIST